MDLIEISKSYEYSVGIDKAIKIPKKLGKKLAAGALAGSMVAGGGVGAAKVIPKISHSAGAAVDELRWTGGSLYGTHGAPPGSLQLSKPDWIKAGRPSSSPESSLAPGAKPGYSTGQQSGYWGTNASGNRELRPLTINNGKIQYPGA